MPCHCDDRANKLRQCVLYFLELEIRNRSAGAALDLYFRVAEAEAKDELLDLGIRDLGTAYEQAKSVAEKGFKLPIELASLARQRLDAETDRVRVRSGLVDLNVRLKGLIGQEDLPLNEQLWPDADFTVNYSPVDVEAAIANAMNQRAELLLLRTLARDLDAKTLPVVREFLQGVAAGLGKQAKSKSPVGQLYDSLKAIVTLYAAERGLRAGQLEQLIADREAAIATEVRQAAGQVAIHAQLVDLGRQRVDSNQARVQEMNDRLEKSAATFLDVLQAKLDWYKARAAFTGDVMGWHRAMAELRRAQGVLVAECCGRAGNQ
jgi:outer membrane protein TolC